MKSLSDFNFEQAIIGLGSLVRFISLQESGVLSDVSIIIGRGDSPYCTTNKPYLTHNIYAGPGTNRVVSEGLSASKVPTPTMMPS